MTGQVLGRRVCNSNRKAKCARGPRGGRGGETIIIGTAAGGALLFSFVLWTRKLLVWITKDIPALELRIRTW